MTVYHASQAHGSHLLGVASVARSSSAFVTGLEALGNLGGNKFTPVLTNTSDSKRRQHKRHEKVIKRQAHMRSTQQTVSCRSVAATERAGVVSQTGCGASGSCHQRHPAAGGAAACEGGGGGASGGRPPPADCASAACAGPRRPATPPPPARRPPPPPHPPAQSTCCARAACAACPPVGGGPQAKRHVWVEVLARTGVGRAGRECGSAHTWPLLLRHAALPQERPHACTHKHTQKLLGTATAARSVPGSRARGAAPHLVAPPPPAAALLLGRLLALVLPRQRRRRAAQEEHGVQPQDARQQRGVRLAGRGELVVGPVEGGAHLQQPEDSCVEQYGSGVPGAPGSGCRGAPGAEPTLAEQVHACSCSAHAAPHQTAGPSPASSIWPSHTLAPPQNSLTTPSTTLPPHPPTHHAAPPPTAQACTPTHPPTMRNHPLTHPPARTHPPTRDTL